MKKVIIVSFLASNILFGANFPNVDAIQNSINLPKTVEEKNLENKNNLIEIDGKKKYAPIMIDDKSAKKLYIKNYTFEGNEHILSIDLEKLTNSFKDKELSFSELQNIASLITKEYRDRGYFVARAYIPKQNIQENDNVLKIAIIEGNYGQFKLTNNSYVKDFFIQAILDDAKSRDDVIGTNTLERSMLIINDLPGVIVSKANVKPGVDVGTSDFEIETQKTSFYDGYLVGDNYGSKFTGKNRIIAGLNLNSPLQLGDKLSFNGLISNGENIKNYKMGYSFPLMANGLKAETSYSKTKYDLVKLDQTTPDGIYDGYTSNIEAGIIYPIIRSRIENLNISTYYSNKKLKDYYDDSISKNREINNIKIGLDYTKNYSLLGFDAYTKLESFYTLGKLNIKDADSKELDKNGVNTQGSYSKVNLNLESEMIFTPVYSLNTNIKTQYALKNKNLDGSEDFTLGGSDGVKVFSDSEQSVENALVFNVEFFTKLPNISELNHKIGFFYDLGTGDMSNSSKDTEFEKRTLQDIGIGYYTNYKNSFTRLQLARVVGGQDIEVESVGNISRVLLQIGIVF